MDLFTKCFKELICQNAYRKLRQNIQGDCNFGKWVCVCEKNRIMHVSRCTEAPLMLCTTLFCLCIFKGNSNISTVCLCKQKQKIYCYYLSKAEKTTPRLCMYECVCVWVCKMTHTIIIGVNNKTAKITTQLQKEICTNKILFFALFLPIHT